MRSLWLASAASLFFAGAACAQSTSPAPTGAPNSATMSAPGQSPGNTGANPAPSTAPDASSSGAAAGNASGVPNAATETTPGTSPGKTMGAGPAPTGGTMSHTSANPMMSSHTYVHHHYSRISMGRGAMPANADADTYLRIAKRSIMHRNKGMADEALSRAETVMLNRAVPQGNISPDTSPGVNAVESARRAVAAGDMKTAMAQTDMAMQQSGGGGGDMSAMPASSSMSSGNSGSPLAGSFKSESMPITKSNVARVGAAAQHPENLGTTPAEGGSPQVPNSH